MRDSTTNAGLVITSRICESLAFSRISHIFANRSYIRHMFGYTISSQASDISHNVDFHLSISSLHSICSILLIICSPLILIYPVPIVLISRFFLSLYGIYVCALIPLCLFLHDHLLYI